MRLQSGRTTATKRKLSILLTKLQEWLRKCNPYVQDCIQVCEIPTEEVDYMQLAINPTVRRGQDHSGIYNQATGLKEVQVLMQTLQQKRSTALSFGKEEKMELCCSFLTSTDHLTLSTTCFSFLKVRIVGMQECNHLCPTCKAHHQSSSVFRTFMRHLHRRNDEREILFRSSRLFQEYCCCAWSRIERQRLFYLSQNQEILRAENYNVLQDHMNRNDALVRESQHFGRAVIHWESTLYERKISRCNGYCMQSWKT
jgi:Helitron helicase-like domain at N-terminus